MEYYCFVCASSTAFVMQLEPIFFCRDLLSIADKIKTHWLIFSFANTHSYFA